MEYGKLQGEILAAGHFSGATPPLIVGTAFNVASVARSAKGLFTVTLGDGVDPLNCAVLANSDTTPNTVTANNGGIDTDTVKNFAVVDAAGAAADAGVYFQIIRTNVS